MFFFFHNLSSYDAHLFIKEPGKETNKVGVIANNKEDYITFSTDVVVDEYVDKDSKEKEKKTQLRFIDSMKFMATSLQSLTNNLVGVGEMKCNLCKEDCDLAYIDECYVVHAECMKCHTGYNKRQLNEKVILDNFLNLRFDHTDKQFRLLLTKRVYPYEYMSSWDKFNETSLPQKEAFYSKLSMVLISISMHLHELCGKSSTSKS